MQVLYRHDLWHDVPTAVRDHLAAGARGRRPETPTEGDSCFDTVKTALVGSNDDALDAARSAAEARGYDVQVVERNVEGEAHEVGRDHVRAMLDAASDSPTCLLWGGETTVTVTGSGTGGRNQEVALGAALALDGIDQSAVLLSGGTDGIDGPTDAAGAWATPETAEDGRAAGCDPEIHRKENDAYPFFDAVDQLLRPGPTHTNVMDLHVGIV
jgi:hydroxypyruvate reductase